MKANGTPENESEAALLRAYVPAATLDALAQLAAEESKVVEKRSSDYEKAQTAYKLARERTKAARAEEKQLKAKADKASLEYFGKPMYERTDAARTAAWIAAAKARCDAIAAGEAPKRETLEECGVRHKAERVA